MRLASTTYDKLKWICLILMPAVSALYFGLAQIWGFPYAEQICGTIAIVQTFAGSLLGISCANYNKR